MDVVYVSRVWPTLIHTALPDMWQTPYKTGYLFPVNISSQGGLYNSYHASFNLWHCPLSSHKVKDAEMKDPQRDVSTSISILGTIQKSHFRDTQIW